MKKFLLICLAALALTAATTEEGMFPLTEISRLDLAKAGLKIPVNEIYNPKGVSLVDAVVRVGGCTGSFISNDGLIITNHHCGFSSVSAASDSTHNYLRDGFYAPQWNQEIKTGLTTKIIASYTDVSLMVLKGTQEIVNDDVLRSKQIKSNIQAIIKNEQANNSTLDYEVSEMFTGRTYILFRYQTIKDIRIVYNPPLAIGEFGGETDNWVWPRHNGDFCILRAYVAPDGTPKEYNTENVPFHPKKFLKVNAKGIKENDFVFILGFPGRTFRHVPSQFVEYQQNYQMPFIADLYEWQIAKMLELGKGSDTKQLYYASKIKGLANTSKNFRGKLQGLARTHLVDQKKADEKHMEEILNTDDVKGTDKTLFKEIQETYATMYARAYKNVWLQYVGNNSYLTIAGNNYRSLKKMYELGDTATTPVVEGTRNALANYNPEIEIPTLAHLMVMAMKFPQDQHVKVVDHYFKGMEEKAIETKINEMIKASSFRNLDMVKATLAKKSAKGYKTSGEFFSFVGALYDEIVENTKFITPWQAKVAALTTRYNAAEMLMNIATYTPDANSTMRLTYGHIKGYAPQDAVYHKPFTTLSGIVEKQTPTGDFVMPPLLRKLSQEHNYGPWKDALLDDVPVGFLYNLDTTGGNSGSPVMDAEGSFIGINFDRAFTATINDYAWNENYSRSIGCDVRYICFVLDKYAHADALLKEMGVKN